jgi:hypothetical protein
MFRRCKFHHWTDVCCGRWIICSNVSAGGFQVRVGSLIRHRIYTWPGIDLSAAHRPTGHVWKRIADGWSVTLHSNAGKCAFGSEYCTQFPEFSELFVLKFRTESDARKKDGVIFVLISWTNFSRNFVWVICDSLEFSAVKMQSNPVKGLKTNKRDSLN